MIKKTLILVLLFLSLGCQERNYYSPTSPSPTDRPNPTPSPAPATVNKIEYRVTGNALGARIRYSNAVDGLTQVVTTLPYVATITTQESSMFITLEATPTTYPFTVLYPFLSVQVFVNGVLFREANTSDFFLIPISVSGTWHK